MPQEFEDCIFVADHSISSSAFKLYIRAILHNPQPHQGDSIPKTIAGISQSDKVTVLLGTRHLSYLLLHPKMF